MEMKELLTEVQTALEALGYDLGKHTFVVRVRTDLTADRCEVRLDGEYFGVWDTTRKTFVD